MADREFISFFKHLASQSTKVINPYFSNPDLEIEWKADNTPVTAADKKAEEVLRETIEKEFPKDSIFGEEHENKDTGSKYKWVIDPIDGTKSFTAGSPLFGTLVALCENEIPIWGMINLPALGKCYIGNNKMAVCNDKPIQAITPKSLSDALLLVTDPKTPGEYHSKQGWDNLVAATGEYRSWGDCFGYTLVASGNAHIMCDPILNYWDLAALLPILRGAGAEVFDWQGNNPNQAKSLIASAPRLKNSILEILNPST